MAESEVTPKNSNGGPFPPQDFLTDSSDDDVMMGPKIITSMARDVSPVTQPKVRPNVLTADFNTPGIGEQVLDQVMDPNAPTKPLFNIVAVSC